MLSSSLQSLHFCISDRRTEPGSSNQHGTTARAKERDHRAETDLPESGARITVPSEHGK